MTCRVWSAFTVAFLVAAAWAFADVDIYVNGSYEGRIEDDGDIYVDGSYYGRVEDNGDVYIDGSYEGRIEDDGDVYVDGSYFGRAQDMPFGGAALVAAYLIFFGGYL
jgi:hypothetical protein